MNLFRDNKMEKRVLVPIDFSEISKEVIHFACERAAKNDSTLYFVHVAMPLGYPGYSGEIVEFPDEKMIKKKIEDFLNPLNIKVKYDIFALFGIPYLEILNKEKQINADLIIMAAHSHTLLGRIFLGGNTDYVLHHCSCPLYVYRKFKTGKVQKIMLPLDYTDINLKVVELADQWAQESGAELYFIHVGPKRKKNKKGSSFFLRKYETEPEVPDEEIGIHEQALQDFIKLLKVNSPHQSALRFGKPYHEILNYQKEIQADLIMMADHSHSFVGRLFTGSNTDYLLNHTDSLMYVYKEKLS